MAAFVLVILFTVALRTSTCAGVRLPNYIPTLQDYSGRRNDIIENYFHLGLEYSEILLFLGLFHGITLSLRQLKRLLKAKGLGRRRNPSDLREVHQAVEEELRGSGSNIGYRQMTQRLVNDYRLVVDRETVRELLKILDPEGVEQRARHRLKRRQYRTKGPNYLWHIDGYDKLKPFGFCIHGAIDGFSRRILWLDVGPTNNDPSVVCQYFIDSIRQLGGTARVIRADCGTENGCVAAAQRFFRRDARDDWAGDNSFMYGKSVSNQRIEAWWGMLGKDCTKWWIDFFKDMRSCGLYSDDDCIHIECLKFCFMHVLRDELHRAARLWNLHRIRPSTNVESPSGRPDVLFFLPEVSNTRNYMEDVDFDELELAEERCCYRPSQSGCSD
ncbi:uncharacterized protein [Montipora foliosa]